MDKASLQCVTVSTNPGTFPVKISSRGNVFSSSVFDLSLKRADSARSEGLSCSGFCLSKLQVRFLWTILAYARAQISSQTLQDRSIISEWVLILLFSSISGFSEHLICIFMPQPTTLGVWEIHSGLERDRGVRGSVESSVRRSVSDQVNSSDDCVYFVGQNRVPQSNAAEMEAKHVCSSSHRELRCVCGCVCMHGRERLGHISNKSRVACELG